MRNSDKKEKNVTIYLMLSRLRTIKVNRPLGYTYLALLSLTIILYQLNSPSGYLVAKEGPVYQLRTTPENKDMTDGVYGITTVSYEKASKFKTLQEILKGENVIPETMRNLSTAREDMDNSKLMAYAVANSIITKVQSNISIEIVDVEPGSLGERLGLNSGDIIEKINDQNTNTVSILKLAKNQKLTLLIKERSGEYSVVKTGNKRPLGIRLREKVLESYPIDTLETGDIGGSSAGLILTMYILDRNSPSDLTNGLRVSGSGTINADGSIGKVNRVEMKYRAAIKEGYDIFFTSDKGLKGEKVIFVNTIQDVLKELCMRGSELACTYTRI